MGTWNGYAAFRRDMLVLLANERTLGRTKYLNDMRREMAAGRHTHYTKSARQRRYNLQAG